MCHMTDAHIIDISRRSLESKVLVYNITEKKENYCTDYTASQVQK